jgi:hypothetical protein
MGKRRRFVAMLSSFLATLLLVVLGAPGKTYAGSLDTSVIGMFPKEVGEFGYVDLKAARQYSWFPQLREQLLPSRFREFEKFLSSAGVDPNSQVDELTWGAISNSKMTSEEVVGIALGSFDPGSTETRFKQQKLPTVDIHGYHLYAFGSGSGPGDILFTFIDANTAAFGNRKALEHLIDVRTGAAESLLTNDQLFPLINEANGTGTVWGVMNQDYAHLAMQQLVPQASQFPQAAAIIHRINAMMFSVKADNGIDATFQAACASTDDANLLSAALQAGLMYRRYQEAQQHPDLAGALDQVRVSSSGDRLKVDAPVSEDTLMSLIHSRALAVTM